MSIEVDAARIFAANEYRWRVNGDLIIPDADQIREHLDKMKAAVDNDEQIVSGHLIVVKTNDTYDVFVHLGEEQ